MLPAALLLVLLGGLQCAVPLKHDALQIFEGPAAVIDPRGVLRELGSPVPDDLEVRVWDSTAELRYLVLPERPAGTQGWSEERLAEIVTRDAMIGVAQVPAPGSGR